MEMRNLSDAEVKTLVIRLLKDVGFQQHKKDPARKEGYTN